MKASPSPDRVFLVPVDFEDASLAALREALELARPLGASVVIFHAHHLPPYVYPGMSAELRERIRQQAADEALARLNALSGRWGVRAVLREGDPADLVICIVTAALSIALIALAYDEVWSSVLYLARIWRQTHSRRALSRTFWGRPVAGAEEAVFASVRP